MKAMMMVMMTAINPLACLSPSPPAPGPGLPPPAPLPTPGIKGGQRGTPTRRVNNFPLPAAWRGRDAPGGDGAEEQLLLPKIQRSPPPGRGHSQRGAAPRLWGAGEGHSRAAARPSRLQGAVLAGQHPPRTKSHPK